MEPARELDAGRRMCVCLSKRSDAGDAEMLALLETTSDAELSEAKLHETHGRDGAETWNTAGDGGGYPLCQTLARCCARYDRSRCLGALDERGVDLFACRNRRTAAVGHRDAGAAAHASMTVATVAAAHGSMACLDVLPAAAIVAEHIGEEQWYAVAGVLAVAAEHGQIAVLRRFGPYWRSELTWRNLAKIAARAGQLDVLRFIGEHAGGVALRWCSTVITEPAHTHGSPVEIFRRRMANTPLSAPPLVAALRRLALASAMHSRLGAASPAACATHDVLQQVGCESGLPPLAPYAHVWRREEVCSVLLLLLPCCCCCCCLAAAVLMLLLPCGRSWGGGLSGRRGRGTCASCWSGRSGGRRKSSRSRSTNRSSRNSCRVYYFSADHLLLIV